MKSLQPAALLLLLSAAAGATPSGHRWSTVPVNYRVYAHTTIKGLAAGVFSTQVLPVVKKAFAHWNASAVSCTNWNTSYQGTFTVAGGPTLALSAADGVNNVVWLSGSNWEYGATTLGVTVNSWYPDTGQLVDADMLLNNDISWKLGGTSAAFDVESVVTHETGHFLGLDHTVAYGAVMSAQLDPGQIRTQLTSADLQDVCGVYPKQSSGGAGTTPYGGLCTTDANCTSGLVCRSAQASTSKICTSSCTPSIESCPYPFTCQTANTGSACLPPKSSPDACAFCLDGNQCSSGLCLTDGRHNFCSNTCDLDLGASACATGYTCVDTTWGAVCQPNAMVCPTPQCTSSSQCPVGYGCVKGMCEATGNTGDRCELSLYCNGCNICSGTQSEAFCLKCCASQSGGYCDSCPAATCGGAETCTALLDADGSALAAKVCVPSGGTSCEKCVTNADCQPGLACINSRCHPSCNPGAVNSCLSGSCTATYSGTPAGACACPDEVVGLGQACGSTSATLRACSSGNLCVGSPAVCRAPCNPTYSGACPSGQACQQVSGQNVCVPTNVAGTRCNACENGNCGAGLTCSGGRCYSTCDLSAPACDGCTDVGQSSAVCACEDEQASIGGACGVKDGHPSVCPPDALCINGTCRQQCTNGTCASGYTCVDLDGSSLCVPPGTSLSTDGGTGSVDTSGCACNSLPSGPAALLGVGLLLHLVRRRDRRRG